MKNYKMVGFFEDIIERYVEKTYKEHLWCDIETLECAKEEIEISRKDCLQFLEEKISELKEESIRCGFCPICGEDLQSKITYHQTEKTPAEYENFCPNGCDIGGLNECD